MDGATSCSWVFVCQCTCVHFKQKIPTIWSIHDKNTNVFFTKLTFLSYQKKKAPNSSESNIVKIFVVRNDEKVARRNNATTLYARRLID